MTRWLGARYPRRRAMYPVDLPVLVRKEDAPCCLSKRDRLGRLPIGYCGPDCVRRAA